MHVERWQCIILVAGGVLPIERSGCLLCLEADLEVKCSSIRQFNSYVQLDI